MSFERNGKTQSLFLALSFSFVSISAINASRPVCADVARCSLCVPLRCARGVCSFRCETHAIGPLPHTAHTCIWKSTSWVWCGARRARRWIGLRLNVYCIYMLTCRCYSSVCKHLYYTTTENIFYSTCIWYTVCILCYTSKHHTARQHTHIIYCIVA